MFVRPSLRLSLSRELEGQAMDIRGETKQRGERGLRLCRPPVLLSRRPAQSHCPTWSVKHTDGKKEG